MEELIGLFLTGLGSMPARCGGRDLAVRRAIDKAVYDLRVEIAEACTKQADERGEPPLDADHGMMTDAEVADQIERTNRFIADFRELVAATAVDPASPCADETRAGFERIAATLDAVPYVTSLQSGEHRRGDARRLAGRDRGQLMCVGGGPTLDYADAAAFLAAYQPVINMALALRLN